MQEKIHIIKTEAFLPKVITFQQATHYTGLSLGTIRNWDKAGLIVTYNVIIPGSTRGRRLICRESIDKLIEGSAGVATTADICRASERGNQQ